jgi:cytochrome P450
MKVGIRLKTLHEPLLYNPFDPAVRADPYPSYRCLRETAPVHHSPLGFWAVSRHADVTGAQRDPRLPLAGPVAAQRAESVAADPSHPASAVVTTWLLLSDPRRHRRFRALTASVLSPGHLESLRREITLLAGALLDELAAEPVVDLVGQFARPLAVSTLCRWLNLPRQDWSRVGHWAVLINRGMEPTLRPAAMREVIGAVSACQDYLRERLAERRSTPCDDVLSTLLAADPEGGPATEPELVAMLSVLLGSGVETTSNLIGNGLLGLLRNPDQLELLQDRRVPTGDAVSELLRYDSPMQLHGRQASSDIEIGGTLVPRGAKVVLLIGSANRDPACFAEPDRLDLRRAAGRHASFGAGAHYCVGAALARIEAEIALELLLDRAERLEPLVGPVSWRQDQVALRGLTALPVHLGLG